MPRPTRSRNWRRSSTRELYCIVLYLPPVLNPVSYDGARVLEASGRPMDKRIKKLEEEIETLKDDNKSRFEDNKRLELNWIEYAVRTEP